MLQSFFYWSGVIAWIVISPILTAAVFFVVHYYCTQVIKPSFENLCFALFGKHGKWMKDMTYYEMWNRQYYWNYRYYLHGGGNKNFARCAWRRLVYEAWKESRKHSREELLGHVKNEK